jgi:ribonucleoside-diphosphate reductase alpha chain
VMAIAPTATISTIVGASQSIEPTYANLYVKSNLSGDFTQVNAFLVADLKRAGLWDAEMLAELKYHDGSVQAIARVPDELKGRYRTAFEIEPEWLIAAASRRQKWIDMGQSLNLYLAAPSGKRLDEIYRLAWRVGLKTTYYPRTTAATRVEKSTLDINRFGIQPRWMKSRSASSDIQVARASEGSACSLDGECEACQ